MAALGLVGLIGLLAPTTGHALVDIPPLTARVQDRAGVLAPGEVASLEATLAGFERETGHQIAILVLPTLEGEAIEAFSIRVASAWKLGDADRDDGIVLVVAVEDRKARIEVGYGLEGALPDALASRIIRERMTPRFREGALAEGLRAGVEAILAATRGEALPAARGEGDGREGRNDGNGMAHGVLIATILGVFLGSQLARRRRGLAPVASGLLAALVAWLITFLVPAVLFAAIAAFALSIVFSASGPGRGMRGGPTVFGPGGFGGGGFGGGGFGGGGFGGGGFGGGGGGFGGGGASGDW